MIIGQLVFAALLLGFSTVCLSFPRVVQAIAVKFCPDYDRGFVETDAYLAMVRVCGGVTLAMTAAIVWHTVLA
jgi:hypothetical protein